VDVIGTIAGFTCYTSKTDVLSEAAVSWMGGVYRLRKTAVLGANVVFNQSTKIIDVSGAEPKEMKGRVARQEVWLNTGLLYQKISCR
jgi:hypothetical protein